MTGLNDPRDQRDFIKRLTETISWCSGAGLLLNPQASLRTFPPTYLAPPDRQVSSVAQSRSVHLWSSGRRDLPAATTLCDGRLLAYFPEDNLACGTAEAESEGFFDVDNVPPFDTWVWLAQTVRNEEYADGTTGNLATHYLVAWVPPDFIELANRGIDVNPEQCILWLDTMDDDFVRSLRRMNLVQGRPLRPE